MISGKRFISFIFLFTYCLYTIPAHALATQLDSQAISAVKRDLVALEKKAREALYGYYRVEKGQFKKGDFGFILEEEPYIKNYADTLPGVVLFMNTLDEESRARFEAILESFDQALAKTEEGKEAIQEAFDASVEGPNEDATLALKKGIVRAAYMDGYTVHDKTLRDQMLKKAYADLSTIIKEYLMKSGAIATTQSDVGSKKIAMPSQNIMLHKCERDL